MDTVPTADARRELAHFLASRRARLTPRDVGLATGRRRRVPGLRREEVAVLANVSETWYTRLEQGQPINASHDVLAAVAQALCLDAHEREYLFMLAESLVHASAAPPAAGDLPASLVTTLDALTFAPAVVYGARWDVRLQNRAYVATFGDIADVPIARGNVVRQVFLDPARRTFFPEWEAVARTLLQSFRVNAGRHVGDPAFAELIAELRAQSADFKAWWDEHDVVRRSIGEKRVNHPVVGELVLDHVAFVLPERPDLTVIVYTAGRSSESERKLRSLLD
jgi:transcriptional regulator with XRE-family HTH domain